MSTVLEQGLGTYILNFDHCFRFLFDFTDIP
jgi:hypothetical protein